jgi:hypothetical protein
MGKSLNCDGSIGGLPNVIAVVIHGCVIKCASHYRAFPTYNENKNFSKKSIFPSI